MEETPIHIFYECVHLKSLQERLQRKFQNDIILPSLTPQAAILGLTNEVNNIYNLLNNILLVSKYYLFNIDILIENLIEIKKKEKRISLVSNNKTETYNKNGGLQVTFYQGLSNMDYERFLGGWEGAFCFVSLFCLYF